MSTNGKSKYFDLHVKGIGYLNRVQEVPGTDGGQFLAVNIAALRGSIDNAQYTYFECIVFGEEAKDLILQLQPAIESRNKVLVGFQLGDPHPEAFTYKNGDHAGQPGACMKARLLRLAWVKVNGQPFPAPQSQEALIH